MMMTRTNFNGLIFIILIINLIFVNGRFSLRYWNALKAHEYLDYKGKVILHINIFFRIILCVENQSLDLSVKNICLKLSRYL